MGVRLLSWRGEVALRNLPDDRLLSTFIESEPVRQALIEARAASETQLRHRFEQAKAEGDPPETVKPAIVASFPCRLLRPRLQEIDAIQLSCW